MALTVREFKSKSGDEKKGEKVVEYNRKRIVLPWSRSGKDSQGNEVVGTVTSLSELLAFVQSINMTTEIKVVKGADGEEVAAGPSFVECAIEGINNHLNRTAKAEAENTEEAALEAVIAVFMKKRGCTREQAIKTLSSLS